MKLTSPLHQREREKEGRVLTIQARICTTPPLQPRFQFSLEMLCITGIIIFLAITSSFVYYTYPDAEPGTCISYILLIHETYVHTPHPGRFLNVLQHVVSLSSMHLAVLVRWHLHHIFVHIEHMQSGL